MPADAEIADLVRRLKKPTLLVAIKGTTTNWNQMLWNSINWDWATRLSSVPTTDAVPRS